MKSTRPMKKSIPIFLAIAFVLGGTLWPQRALSHDTLTTTVLFDREIVRILNSHCVMCHDVNGPAFPLDTYEQTFLLRREIRFDVIGRHMAPWAAVSGYGSFVNDNSLTLREIQFFVSWAEGWGPRNSGVAYTDVAQGSAQLKPVAAHIDFNRWALGEPTRTLEISSNAIEPHQAEETKRTVVDLGLTSERWLTAVEYKPSDHRAVHAAFFSIQETGQWIGSWTPWYGFVNLQKGLAYRLPAGSHLAAEIHYGPAKESVVEHGSLGLFFADRPSAREVSDVVLDSKGEIPANAHSQKVEAGTKLTADTNILALWPEIHPGMKSVEVFGQKPDGETQVLLFAKDFPLDWPTPYIFKEPITLPKGTELSVAAYYANAGPASQPVALHLTVSGYQGTALPPDKPVPEKAQKSSPQRYKLDGTVQTVNAKDSKLVVQHSAIPGFMPAMTMQYDAGKQEDLKNISAGDRIQADLVVVDAEMHLENIKVVSHAK